MPNVLKIPIQGATAAAVVPFTVVNGEITAAGTPLHFDNLASGTQFKIPAPEAASADSTYIEWKRTDGATVRYPANTMVIDGPSGTEVAGGAGSGGGAKSEITLVTNNICVEHTNFKDFLTAVEGWYTTPVLVCLALGKDHAGSTSDIGFAFVLGQLTSELPIGPGGNEAQTYTLTISAKSYAFAAANNTAIRSSLTATGFLGNTTPLLGSGVVTFPDITTVIIDKLVLGQHARV